MEITLNHTIIHSKNRVESAKWYSEIFGFEFIKEWGPFAVVKVNSTLSLDFINKTEDFPSMHYAFKVSDSDFDMILGRLKKEDINYNSSPISIKNNTYDFMVSSVTSTANI